MKTTYFILGAVTGFNFDIKWPFIKKGQPGSNFGYAVESVKFDSNKQNIIVGAPTLRDESEDSLQTGGVYSCPFTEYSFDCIKARGLPNQYNNSRYGQTLASTNEKLIACAPKFTKTLHRAEEKMVESILGSCDLYKLKEGDYLLQDF